MDDSIRLVHQSGLSGFHLTAVVWFADRLEGQKASDKFYWDAKFSSAQGYDMLFAASAAQTVDVYTANYHNESTQ